MKKILIAVTRAEMGGAQKFVVDLARGLQGDFEVLVASGPEGEYLKKALEGIEYQILPSLKRSYNPFSILRAIGEIWRLIGREKPDIVHINSSHALLFAIAARLRPNRPKIVFTFHGLSFADPSHRSSELIKSLYAFAYRVAAKLIDTPVFVSKRDRELAEKLRIIEEGEGKVIRNSVAVIDFVDRDEARNKLSGFASRDLNHSFIVGTIGRLAYPKNQKFLIENFSEMAVIEPRTALILMGDGPDRSDLEGLVRKLDIEDRVLFLGEIENASRYLKGFDLFVLPSIYEGMSLSLLEAQSAGIPILAHDAGGNSECLEGYEGGKVYTKDNFIESFKSIRFVKPSPRISTTSMIDGYKVVYLTYAAT